MKGISRSEIKTRKSLPKQMHLWDWNICYRVNGVSGVVKVVTDAEALGARQTSVRTSDANGECYLNCVFKDSNFDNIIVHYGEKY